MIALCVHRLLLALLDIICDPEIFPDPRVDSGSNSDHASALKYLEYTLWSFSQLVDVLDKAIIPIDTSDHPSLLLEQSQMLRPYACRPPHHEISTYSTSILDNRNDEYIEHVLLFLWLFMEDEAVDDRYNSIGDSMDLVHRQDEGRAQKFFQDIFFSPSISTGIVNRLLADFRYINSNPIRFVPYKPPMDMIALDLFGFLTCGVSHLPNDFEKEAHRQIGNLMRVFTIACRQCLCRYLLSTGLISKDLASVAFLAVIDGTTGLGRIVENLTMNSIHVAKKFLKQPETIALLSCILLLSVAQCHPLCIDRIEIILTKFSEAFIYLRTTTLQTSDDVNLTIYPLFQAQVRLVAQKTRENIRAFSPSINPPPPRRPTTSPLPIDLQYRLDNFHQARDSRPETCWNNGAQSLGFILKQNRTLVWSSGG
ncbi:hypothetical protein ABKN59_009627 [Abortiporus biennis]